MSAVNTSLKIPSSTFEHDPDLVVEAPVVDDDPSDSEEREERKRQEEHRAMLEAFKAKQKRCIDDASSSSSTSESDKSEDHIVHFSMKSDLDLKKGNEIEFNSPRGEITEN